MSNDIFDPFHLISQYITVSIVQIRIKNLKIAKIKKYANAFD